MNDEQKARLAAIAREWAMMCQYPTVERDDAHWLLALVRELAEENARLGQPRATLYSESDAAQELKRAEQQLAAVTTERDAEVRANVGLMACNRALSAERDELKHEVERLKQEASESLAARLFNDALLRERAEKADAERDALQGVVSRCGSRIGAIEGRERGRMMSEIPFYPDEITIEERVKQMRRLCQEVRIEQEADRVRIADLEKQIAEQTKRAETAEQDTRDALKAASEWEKDAEAAEKRVAELERSVAEEREGRISIENASLPARFWSKVRKAGPDECWEWLGAKNTKDQRGKFWAHGKIDVAARIAMELDGRPLKDDEWALHTCDNPTCVNPRHLFAGDRIDNIEDAVTKGRTKKKVCAKGHSMADAYVTPRGVRSCSTCNKERDKSRDRAGESRQRRALARELAAKEKT